MTSDRGFEAYWKQLVLITDWMSANRAASGFEDREAKLKAACEQAVLSLSKDLQAISELEERLTERYREVFEERRRADDRWVDRLLNQTGSEGAFASRDVSPRPSSPIFELSRQNRSLP